MSLSRHLSILALLLLSSMSYSQTDSLLNAFKGEADIEKAGEIIKTIVNKCKLESSCYGDLNKLLAEGPPSEKKAKAHLIIANSFYRGQELIKGKNHALHGIENLNKLKSPPEKYTSFVNSLSSFYRDLNDIDSAIIYADKTEKILLKDTNKEKVWQAYYNKYLAYVAVKNYKNADLYLVKSYDALKNSDNRMNKGFVLHSILLAKKNRGTKKEFDYWLDEFLIFKKQGKGPLDAEHLGLEEMFDDKESGIKYLEERIKALEVKNDPFDSPDLTRNLLATKYEKAGRYDEAVYQYQKILDGREGNIFSYKGAYLGLYEVYKKQGRDKEAYGAIEKYLELQDSTYKAIEKKNINEFEVKYRTQEKEKEIVLQNAQLIENKLQLRSSVILISGLILLAFVIFFAMRNKIKFTKNMHSKEKELQQQKIKELEQNNKLLSLNSMIEGQEVERLRIAQDLHDGLGGLLTTVKAHFNTIEKEIENIRNINLYEKTNKLIDEACIEVRRIAHDMVPHSIKISGLRGALDDLKNSIVTRGLDCEIEIHGEKIDQLPAEKASMIYRIIQEVTNNAVKHAEANKLFIQLMEHENNLHITIEDDGRGFDINNILSKKGLGLRSIDSRINYLEGNINYDSSPNHGTTINIEIPVK